jgi:glycosyltransferase involved in cell wall biosynthesis
MTEPCKTLVILSPGFPANEADSACLPPQQVFVRNLKQNYPALHIIILAFEYPHSSTEYQWNDVTVMPFGGRNRGKLFRRANWIRIRLKLSRLNKQYQLLGLLSFWLGDCAYIAHTFAQRNNLRHFCWILGQDAKPSNKYVKLIKPGSESLIALSDFIADEFYKNYAVKPAHVMPIGIDTTLFDQAPVERDIDILGVGSPIPLKQFHLLVSIVNSLRDTFANIKAVICGDGPEVAALHHLIKADHLENHISLTGELPHASVLKLMQRSKILVHPSSYEGFGVVCLEALYAGAKVVSFVRPMRKPIKNWHFAQNTGDMVNVLRGLLEEDKLDHAPISPFLIADTCKAVMDLYEFGKSPS